MINFNLKGISLVATVEMLRISYKDAKNDKRTRFEREIKVAVHFWEFSIIGNLQELAFVKSALQGYMLSYWKRPERDESKIDFAKTLDRDDVHYGCFWQSLSFVARQQAFKYYLHISVLSSGNTQGEAYLDGQEVMMLDIAINKAISLLSPERTHSSA